MYSDLIGRLAGTETIFITLRAEKMTWLPPRFGLRHSMPVSAAMVMRSSIRQPEGFWRIFVSVLPAGTQRHDTASGIKYWTVESILRGLRGS